MPIGRVALSPWVSMLIWGFSFWLSDYALGLGGGESGNLLIFGLF